MIAACKDLGCPVELVTNGLLMDEGCVKSLLATELDRVWVSLDGGFGDCGEQAGHGESLETVKRNIRGLTGAKFWSMTRKPRLGVVFVATQINISELPEVYRLATNYLADRLLVSNLLPYTEEMTGQVLYTRSQWNWRGCLHSLMLPRIDVENDVFESLKKIGRNDEWNCFTGQEFKKPFDTCPFIERGSLAVRWDGQVSPCLPLLHDYDSYLGQVRRRTHSFCPGSLRNESLLFIWNKPEYVKLRTTIREFDFSPCSTCRSCEFAESNEEDCFGNRLPACGGCLWAQGFIQCP
jgi:MoaA/NifB/PqqE/SkfB family radical SAM enzyme